MKNKLTVWLAPILVGLNLFLGSAHGLNNGLALTPPMGWNPYNTFWTALPEDKLLEMAHLMIKTGMRDAGYKYIALDCGWSIGPDSNGVLQPKPHMYPRGLKALADSIHALGLKFSMYADIGVKGCCGSEETYPNYKGNADQWAAWGVDYVKVDFCGSKSPVWWDKATSISNYVKLRDAIKQTNRPIVYSICEWGENKPWEWADTVGNLWRTTLDIDNNWNRVMELLPQNDTLWRFAGPGHWNDADMLVVGRLAINESRAHFSIWCMLASPLMAGNDLRNMDDTTKSILLNAEAIAIDQDSLGAQGRRIDKDQTNGNQIWLKPLRDGSKAVLFFNRGGDGKMSVKWSEIGISGSARVRDIWLHKDMGSFTNEYSVTVPGSDVVMVRISGANVITSTVSKSVKTMNPNILRVKFADLSLRKLNTATLKSFDYRVFDQAGKEVRHTHGKLVNENQILSLSLSGLRPGVYLVKLKVGSQEFEQTATVTR